MPSFTQSSPLPLTVEQVFKTEGVPRYTFVRPPNYNDILIDIRSPGKPVIIEGQSGTGKTTTVKKIIEEVFSGLQPTYLTPREPSHLPQIISLAESPKAGTYIIDDFHRLDVAVQEKFANTVKFSAEIPDPSHLPKLIIIGINRVGSSLVGLVHDLSKRIGIHRIPPADEITMLALLEKGEIELNIEISDKNSLYNETRGDYWLTQLLAQNVCLMNNVLGRMEQKQVLNPSLPQLRIRVMTKLEHTYDLPIKEFCRGKRFRPTNDPYFKVLEAVSKQGSSIVDLTELANANPDVRGSINNIKEIRLGALIASKPLCSQYFYYNNETKNLAIEDPALFYFLKIADWDKIKRECGFRSGSRDFEFDFALSFAGERRDLAREISSQLELLDCSVFFDEAFEANFLGKTWSGELKKVFREKSRFIVCLLDSYHKAKIWPTFERDCFIPRVSEEEVFPIYLDDTIFQGIPSDLIGIKFDPDKTTPPLNERVTDEIVFKLCERLET